MAELRAVARYLISLSQESTRFAITPLKLQKLVYYAQGRHLVNFNEPLFDDDLVAWDHGPVVRQLYNDYKHYGYNTIPQQPFNNIDEQLTEEEINSINAIWDEYGFLDGKLLEELTHQEDPWLFTLRNEIIDVNLIRDYFENGNN
ncbi:Panacea domain-containing protein [Guptibacillus hwajinpoensis]|uniref:Panacea domain-containing protein n=1 Tax=Guptibacillus hwajinpoensis TaxID=208199 RepID=UPI003D002CAA